MIRHNRHHCRGSVYFLVLASAMLVTLLAMGGILALRVQNRAAVLAEDMDQARLLACSGIELGQLLIANDSKWRTDWINGQGTTRNFGGGTISMTLTDPSDGDLADSMDDSAVLTVVATYGRARQMAKITLTPKLVPLDILHTAVHSDGQTKVTATRTLKIVNAPVSTNSKLDKDGTIYGDVEAVSITGLGWVYGSITCPASVKTMPASTVFQRYKNLATPISSSDTMEKFVLTPTYNPFGQLNADGVYYIDAENKDLTLRSCRVYGTLVITAKKVTLSNAVLLQNARANYPALIVQGNVVFAQSDYSLSESYLNTNFNPPGAEYQGGSDADKSDTYPNQVNGLTYLTGNLTFQNSPVIQGTIVVEGTTTVSGNPTLTYDSNILTYPPTGFTQATTQVQALGETWTQSTE
jgi:hypothetical protein